MGNTYNCDRCKKTFPVKPYIVKTLIRFGKDAFCPFCGKNDKTNKIGSIKRKFIHTGLITDPPSSSQLSYIESLGGNSRSVKTKGDAGAYISALKKRVGKKF